MTNLQQPNYTLESLKDRFFTKEFISQVEKMDKVPQEIKEQFLSPMSYGLFIKKINSPIGKDKYPFSEMCMPTS